MPLPALPGLPGLHALAISTKHDNNKRKQSDTEAEQQYHYRNEHQSDADPDPDVFQENIQRAALFYALARKVAKHADAATAMHSLQSDVKDVYELKSARFWPFATPMIPPDYNPMDLSGVYPPRHKDAALWEKAFGRPPNSFANDDAFATSWNGTTPSRDVVDVVDGGEEDGMYRSLNKD